MFPVFIQQFYSFFTTCIVFETSSICYPQIWPIYRVLGGEEHLKTLLVWDLSRWYQFYALQLAHSLLQLALFILFIERGLSVKNTVPRKSVPLGDLPMCT